MAVKILLKDYRPSIVFLRKTNANFAINKHPLTFKSQNINVRGFLGVTTPQSMTLSGAVIFQYNGVNEEIVFDIKPVRGSTQITTVTNGLLQDDEYRSIVKNFINSLRAKLIDRMVQRDLYPAQTGGGGTRPRFEGRTRTSGAGPSNYFTTANSNGEFTAAVTTQASLLSIHYR